MGEINDIAIVGIINDILKYEVSLMFTKVHGVFHVTLTWIGATTDGNSAMGIARGTDKKLYFALSTAYKAMIEPHKETEEKSKPKDEGPEAK